jgi:tRNA modification GTPase
MSSLDPQQTIVALSSAVGPGLRAVIRLSGPESLRVSARIFTPVDPIVPGRRHAYAGEIRIPSFAAPIPGDMHVWRAPHTYTGQELIELHTFSSMPLVEAIVAALLDAGARAARPGEFTLRAFLAGKLDLPRAEAVLGVIEAQSRNELGEALAQLTGGVTRPLQALRDELLDLLADVEAGLDFADEDLQFADQRALLDRLTRGLAHVTHLQRQLEKRARGDRAFRVVLAGRPNVGKSSLFNALAGGPTALVAAEPGTTRDYLLRRVQWEDATLDLVDTAGLDGAITDIDTQAQVLGKEQHDQADLVLLCLEAGTPLTHQERAWLARAAPPVVVGVATKADLGGQTGALLATSALTSTGLPELRALLAGYTRSRTSAGLVPSLGRCRHHLTVCLQHLRQAHRAVLEQDPAEVVALEIRGVLDELGEIVGAVYTDDLLDRIFSRFCIGK